jgi:hypothetical protein
VIAGRGELRLEGIGARSATIVDLASGRQWRAVRRRWWSATVDVTDVSGTVVGTFEPALLRRGGTLTWGGRTLTLRSASLWRERYALAEGEREVAVFDERGWGKRPLTIQVSEETTIGLLLFAAFVVRTLAADATSAAGAGASTAAIG